jgi:hypothetical protein
MSWTDSHIFRAWVQNPMMKQGTAPTGGTGEIVTNDTVKAALFNNSVSPDADAAVALSGYNGGTWSSGNEVAVATQWVAGGRALASKTYALTAGGIGTFNAANLAGTSTVTLANVYGMLLYDDTITGGTVADQGICFLYFGGPQGVTAGTFTVNWNPSGIFNFDV